MRAALEYLARGWPLMAIYRNHGGRCACAGRRCNRAGRHVACEIVAGDQVARLDWAILNLALATGDVAAVRVAPGPSSRALGRLRAAGRRIESDLTIRGGNGAITFIYRSPRVDTGLPDDVVRVPTRSILSGISIVGDGGWVLLPPSLHTNGALYVWCSSIELRSLSSAPPMPFWLVELCAIGPVTESLLARELWELAMERLRELALKRGEVIRWVR